MVPFSAADTVIGAEGIELIEAGDFSDSEQWEISATAGFSSEQAEYSGGMVADGELSFTHDRPDNFEQVTSWATNSPTLSNATLGEPDSYYTWSKGPNITMNGYDFAGLHGMQIANVSMVLHFSIPDALSQDTVRVVLQNHGFDKLVVTFGHTFGPILRMSNPLVLPLEDLVQIDWGALEGTQFTVDYTSQGTSDDSEVQVDAVGLRVKYHQPWYSFETTKARHTLNGVDSPVVDFGPYDGEISGLSQVSCGLTPNGPEAGMKSPLCSNWGGYTSTGPAITRYGLCPTTSTETTARRNQGNCWTTRIQPSKSASTSRTGASPVPEWTSTTRTSWPMEPFQGNSEG